MMLKAALHLSAAAILASASPVAAEAVLTDGIADARILPGWQEEDGTYIAALHLRMQPGWHTYWRAPGEAGIPPQFGWGNSGNLKSAVIEWPRPDIFSLNGMRTLGYEGDVVLPIRIAPENTTVPVTLDAEVDLGVCDEICVPVSLRVKAVLPAEGGRNDMIQSALQTRPRSGGTTAQCTIEPISDGLRLRASIETPKLNEGEVAVIEVADKTIWISTAETARQGNSLTAVADLVPPDGQPFALDRSGVRITVIGVADSVEFLGCAAG